MNGRHRGEVTPKMHENAIWLIEESYDEETSSGYYKEWKVNTLLGFFTSQESAVQGLAEHQASEAAWHKSRMDEYNAKCEKVRQRAVKAQKQGFMVSTSEYPNRPAPLPEWRLTTVEPAVPNPLAVKS